MPVVVPPPKKVMLKTTLEVALMTVLALPMIYIHVIIDEFPPYKRGFYCDDENLRHPYKEEVDIILEVQNRNSNNFAANCSHGTLLHDLVCQWIDNHYRC